MDFGLLRWEELMSIDCPCLFKSEDGHPITFYFHIDSKEFKTKFEDLTVKCGGQVMENYFKMTPRTALMVDRKSITKIYKRVSFDVEYIIDCVMSRSLKDINSYICNCLPNFMNKKYMDVIFWRRSTFSDESDCEEAESTFRKSINGCSSSTHSSDDDFYFDLSNTVVQKVKGDTKTDLSRDRAEKNHLIKKAEGGNKRDKFGTKNGFSNKKCMEGQCSKSCKETVINRKEKAHQPIAGTSKFSVQKSQPCRNSDDDLGMRQYDQPQITRRKIKKFPPSKCINSCSSNCFKSNISRHRSSSDSSSNSINSKIVITNHHKKSRCRLSSSSSSDSENLNDERISEREDISPVSSSRDRFNENNYHVASEEEDDIEVPPSSKIQKKSPNKHTRLPYRRKEQEDMLKYILKKDAFNYVYGLTIWKKMERSNICPNRTWMSLANHYKRTLVNILETFPFLTKDNIKALRKQKYK